MSNHRGYGNGRDRFTTLWLVPVDGREPRPLLRASPPEMIIGSLVKWSKDGKSVLIAKEKGDDLPSEIWRVSVGTVLLAKST